MTVAATIAGAALVAVPALLLPALLGVRGRAGYALAAAVVATGDVVLVAFASSLAGAFTTGAVLAGHALLAAAAAVAWALLGRPAPPRARLPAPRAALAAARAHPAVGVLTGAAAVALLVQLFQGVAVVSNGWDPMSYHLSRAAYWVQYESVLQFPGGTVRQLGYPPNGEILQAWTMLLTGGDALVSLVQWASLVAIAAAIYAIARELRFARPAALFAAALFATMPIPILEATTGQNDLIVTFFLLATVLFGVRGLRDGHRGEIAVAGAALGLAVGTKGTALIAGPSLLVVLAAVLAWHRPARRTLALGAVAALLGVAALGAFNYVENVAETGDVFGNAPEHIRRTSPLVDNAIRIHWGWLDLPGVAVPWLDRATVRFAPNVLGELGRPDFGFNVDAVVDDSQSAFGPTGLLLLLPILVVTALRRRSPRDRRALALAALVYMAVFPVVSEYTPDQARLLVPAVALGAPLLALAASRAWLRALAVGAALVVLVPSLVDNHWRPLLVQQGSQPAFRLDRTAQFGIVRATLGEALRGLDARLGPEAPIGFAGPDDASDYPFFGPGLDRRVVRLDAGEVTLERMRAERLAGVVVERGEPPAALASERLSAEHVLVLPRPAGR